jgi:thioredoxin 1
MKRILIIILSIAVCVAFVIGDREAGAQSKPTVTFIELGSVNCLPCKQMQPVMKKVEQKYGAQVKVVFYDVWTDKDKAMAYKYKIRAIPTQVFLSADGKEYSRHEGYFPFEELEKVLKQKGVK